MNNSNVKIIGNKVVYGGKVAMELLSSNPHELWESIKDAPEIMELLNLAEQRKELNLHASLIEVKYNDNWFNFNYRSLSMREYSKIANEYERKFHIVVC